MSFILWVLLTTGNGQGTSKYFTISNGVTRPFLTYPPPAEPAPQKNYLTQNVNNDKVETHWDVITQKAEFYLERFNKSLKCFRPCSNIWLSFINLSLAAMLGIDQSVRKNFELGRPILNLLYQYSRKMVVAAKEDKRRKLIMRDYNLKIKGKV